MKKISLILIILVIYISNSFGQKDFRNGFIITLQNDTINGRVDYRSNIRNYKSCIFRGEQGEVKYLPNQIIGFGYVDDKFYSSQVVNDQFVEVLVVGDISLFKSEDRYYVMKDSNLYEIESVPKEVEKDGKVIIMEDNRWRGILYYLINDCIANANNIVYSLKFDEKNITNLIVNYNECTNAEYVEYKSHKPWTKFSFGASVGMVSSVIHAQDQYDVYPQYAKEYSSVDPVAGVLVSVYSPRINERIALQGEAYFMKSGYSSLVVLKDWSTEYYDTYIDLSSIFIPLSVKYSFPEKKYGVYFQAGLNLGHHFKAETRLLHEKVTNSVVNIFPETSAFEVNKDQIGYWGGIGIIKSYSGFSAGIALRFSQMTAFSKTDRFDANNNSISINLILFKK